MTAYRPMATAPKDGREVWINTFAGEARAYYYDCAWLRADFAVGTTVVRGDPTVTDCWRRIGGNGDDIELKDALGWREA